MVQELELPWMPSVNHYYRHVGSRVLISRDGRRYRENIISKLKSENIQKHTTKVEIEIELYPPDNRRRDVDNCLKSLLDALAFGGLYNDDSQIYKLIITKREPMPPNGLVFIRIREWENDKIKDIDVI